MYFFRVVNLVKMIMVDCIEEVKFCICCKIVSGFML